MSFRRYLQEIDNDLRCLSIERRQGQTREELDGIMVCLGICDNASKHVDEARLNDFENVSTAPDAHRVVISTIGDLLSAESITRGEHSRSLLGQMSDSSLKQILRYRQDVGEPMESERLEPSPILPTPTCGDSGHSDIDSIKSVEDEIFSSAGSVSFSSTIASGRSLAIEAVAGLFVKSAELLALYEEAVKRLDKDRFVRNQRRILKENFQDLRPGAQNQLQNQHYASFEVEAIELQYLNRSGILLIRRIPRNVQTWLPLFSRIPTNRSSCRASSGHLAQVP